ncbi:MAG TPA: hypothetical protein VNO79_10670 [Actinomycetota bacterium]|nr:hypothetical protein [Actinomycetota bacterium]
MRFLDFLRRPKPWGHVVPDVVGEISAWRCWVLAHDERGPYLRSYYAPVRWPPGEVLVATCLAADPAFRGMAGLHEQDEPPPGKACRCGIYGVASPEHHDLRYYLAHEPKPAYPSTRPVVVVGGEVALWGRVRVGEHGWRAQYARPVAFHWHREGEAFPEGLAELAAAWGAVLAEGWPGR